ncbi:MAG TPA: hypothetical protein VFE98_10215 [Candidatus Bathyarchaeia archaeon]|nr:hypothetical protein [Candidatus Bathyarchaeia archaeon]
MPLKIVRPDHYEVVGTRQVMLTASHAAERDAGLYMGQIVEEAALLSKAYAVIGKVNRDFSDANRFQSARLEFSNSIQTYVDEYRVKYILDINGKKDPGVDIVTSKGGSASKLTADILRGILDRDFKVTVDSHVSSLDPGSIFTGFDKKDSSGGFVVQAVQIIIGPDERTLERAKVVRDIADIVGLLNRRLSLVADESGGSGLD